MPWNYRVIELPEDEEGECWVDIRSVYYDNQDSKVYDYTDQEDGLEIETIAPKPELSARSLEDLVWKLEKMLAATKKEILETKE
jgi:hypothetical protein